MDDCKKDVTIWYDAFNTKDPRLVDRILSEDREDWLTGLHQLGAFEK
jgi:hypothetical protein